MRVFLHGETYATLSAPKAQKVGYKSKAIRVFKREYASKLRVRTSNCRLLALLVSTKISAQVSHRVKEDHKAVS